MPDFDEEALAEAYNRGLRLEKAGAIAGAVAAYRQALAIDPADHCGLSIRLAAMGLGTVPTRMPDAYVATLFDQHAEDFDEILVDALGYCVPLLLREALRTHAPGPYASGLDLGCGTGLTGLSLNDICAEMTGVDLSEKMVEMAYDRGVYAALYTGEAVEFLREFEEENGARAKWDLIVATDVFPYLGDVAAFMSAARERVADGGVLAFSTETLAQDDLAGRSWTVSAKRRYAHAVDYIRDSLTDAGFTVLAIDEITVRREDDQSVPGHLVLSRRS